VAGPLVQLAVKQTEETEAVEAGVAVGGRIPFRLGILELGTK
jgi:hypothetical protein